jgi:hypothetical protein
MDMNTHSTSKTQDVSPVDHLRSLATKALYRVHPKPPFTPHLVFQDGFSHDALLAQADLST